LFAALFLHQFGMVSVPIKDFNLRGLISDLVPDDQLVGPVGFDNAPRSANSYRYEAVMSGKLPKSVS
jgi:hypothetical protein